MFLCTRWHSGEDNSISLALTVILLSNRLISDANSYNGWQYWMCMHQGRNSQPLLNIENPPTLIHVRVGVEKHLGCNTAVSLGVNHMDHGPNMTIKKKKKKYGPVFYTTRVG